MDKPFYSPCHRCKRETRHQVVHKVTERGDENYDFYQEHAIIECLGCETKSFRDILREIEHAYPVGENEWEVPEEVKLYPMYNPKVLELDRLFIVPDLVSEIYSESMLAVQSGALTLAGLGLRGTIEAVCNDRAIAGRNLEVRIGRLATQGLISAKDAERLHAIRFLGNDAAHEIKKPSVEQISVAVKIINHLIQSVYLLEAEMDRQLDTIISDTKEFERLLNKHLKRFNKEDEVSIAEILGKDLRRLGQGASQLEAHLVSAINAGDYDSLTIGKVVKHPQSKGNLQYFIVG